MPTVMMMMIGEGEEAAAQAYCRHTETCSRRQGEEAATLNCVCSKRFHACKESTVSRTNLSTASLQWCPQESHPQRVMQASSSGTRYFGLDFKDIEICIGSNQARLVPETKILQIRSQPCARLLRAPSISQFHATGGQCRRRPVTSKEWYSLAAPTRRYSREKAAAARPAVHTSNT